MSRYPRSNRPVGGLLAFAILASPAGIPAALAAAPVRLAAQAPSDTAPRPISLDEAVALAQKNAPAAVQARGQLRTTRAAVSGAYAAFIPTVNANLSRSYRAGNFQGERGVIIPFTGQPWSSSDGLSFNTTIFDGGRRFFAVGQAKANVAAAQAADVTQQFQTSLAVKQAFFAALAAQESQAAARAQLAQAEQQLTSSTARVAAGAATRSDSLRSVILVGNAQLALVTAQNNLRTANATLTRLVATPFEVTPAPSDSLGTAIVPLDSTGLATLAESGPAVRQASAAVRAAQAASRAARAPYLPSLDVSFSRTGAGFDAQYGFGEPFAYQSSVRLTLSYPIFNGLVREQQVVQADVARTNAEAALRDARFAAREQLTQYLGALRTAEQQVVIQTASVAAAEEDLRVQQQRYAVGASVLLDVLTSTTTLNQARAALISARYDYRVARAQLEAVVGRTLSGDQS